MTFNLPQFSRERTWILVANRMAARLYEFPFQGSLKQLKVFSNEYFSPDFHSNHSTNHKENLIEIFAKKLSTVLSIGGREERFKKLVLVAEPHFLGEIKRSLDKKSKSRLLECIRKDLMPLTKKKVMDHLNQSINFPLSL